MAATDPNARYRTAWKHGHAGRALPEGLSSLADSDPLVDQAHDAGRDNVSFDDFLAAHGRTSSPAPAPRRPPAAPRRAAPATPSLGTGARSAANTVGSALLGLVAAALVLSVIDYGASGPLLWFKAKFLNEAAPAAASSSSTSTANASPATTSHTTGTLA